MKPTRNNSRSNNHRNNRSWDDNRSRYHRQTTFNYISIGERFNTLLRRRRNRGKQ
jgi:hypothetical protein